uniref:Uncharacterized protein n=1 Tax=Arundo donax TaxID=35708 RepID=A0A0A9B706_ARUDO
MVLSLPVNSIHTNRNIHNDVIFFIYCRLLEGNTAILDT